MRVGIVCEGPTDFYAIKSFLGNALEASNLVCEFHAIQPEMDQTLPEAGWGNVLLWLYNNPPALRIEKYFGGGLFGGNLSTPPMDALIFQIDSDILGDESFASYLRGNFDYTVRTPVDPAGRAAEIRTVLTLAIGAAEMNAVDLERHVLLPAVESTEASCVAAFSGQHVDAEQLSGQAMIDAFMSALETTEGNVPSLPYARINKSPARRQRLCQRLANSSHRVVDRCASFRDCLTRLENLSNP